MRSITESGHSVKLASREFAHSAAFQGYKSILFVGSERGEGAVRGKGRVFL